MVEVFSRAEKDFGLIVFDPPFILTRNVFAVKRKRSKKKKRGRGCEGLKRSTLRVYKGAVVKRVGSAQGSAFN